MTRAGRASRKPLQREYSSSPTEILFHPSRLVKKRKRRVNFPKHPEEATTLKPPTFFQHSSVETGKSHVFRVNLPIYSFALFFCVSLALAHTMAVFSVSHFFDNPAPSLGQNALPTKCPKATLLFSHARCKSLNWRLSPQWLVPPQLTSNDASKRAAFELLRLSRSISVACLFDHNVWGK